MGATRAAKKPGSASEHDAAVVTGERRAGKDFRGEMTSVRGHGEETREGGESIVEAVRTCLCAMAIDEGKPIEHPRAFRMTDW